MKKVLYCFLLLFLLVPMLIHAEDKVKVYIFREYNCPNCDDAQNFFEELQSDEELMGKFDLEYLDVYSYDDSDDLMEKTGELLGTNYNGSPFIVISDKYYMGFNSSFAEDIRNTILDCYNNQNFKDVVAEAKKEIGYPKDYDYDLEDDIEYYVSMFFESMFVILAIIFGFIGFAVLVFIIVCKWILFKKCDKPGWAAIIPIYSDWVFFEICGYSGAYSLLYFLPFGFIAVVVVKLIASIALAEKFGKDGVVGITIPLIPIVGYPLFAFTKSKYQK